MAAKEYIIEVSNVRKKFKKYEREAGALNALKSVFKRNYKVVEAVKNASFKVKKGEILGYLGPNGAGKSTVIKMLTGILHPDEGTIRCMKYDPWKDREDYVKHIGVVFGQKSTLWWDLPAVDTYILQKDIYEIPEGTFRRRLNSLLKLLEVKDVSKTPVRKLSLGQKMKCEFIASVLHNPKILFLDEPTIGLDVVAKEKIRQFIKSLNRKFDTTVILTTHDLGDVEELCDRIIVVDKGKHVYEGSIVELKKKYATTKKITVEFDERPGRIRMRSCKIVKLDPWKAEITVNIKKRKVSEVIETLMKEHKVTDITISDESIESIIRKIYSAPEMEKK